MLRTPRVSSAVVPNAIPAGSAETIANCDDLRFSSDAEPGITRRRAGSGFYYVQSKGQRVSDETTLARIRKLAIPPAYRDVWICRDPHGHLQATGIDARGRKQYRYHERWRSVRDEHKFERMMGFGRALPKIHRRITRDMKLTGLPREKVLATVVRLLESTLIRIGNDEYARTNKSYGLTTLRNRHVKLKGDRVRFSFRGKHGIRHEVEVEAPRVARILRKCLDLPGQDLFEYVDADGSVRNVTSSDVNQYLREITGEPYTAKDFRTWHATIEVLELLTGQPFTTARESKAKLKEALQSVAQRLGNTPTMCRKCYVNPVVIDAFLAGELRDRALKGGGNERVRLLHLLTGTPSGVAFKRAPTQRASPKAAHRSGSIHHKERLNHDGRRVRTHAHA
jgi:DNA topoisomerase-1